VSQALGQTVPATVQPSSLAATAAVDERGRTLRRTAPGSGRAAELPGAIGRFVVLRKLGEGGMGVVVAAFDEALDRKLAIKLRHGLLGGDDELVRARMLREAQAMARLSHPNVVQIYEVGEHEGQLYVAMEFVRGQTLREWQAAGARRWPETVAMYMQAAQGLAAAHAAGIVHRDFKPENVLVGEDGRARVLDFGLARGSGSSEAARRAEAEPAARAGPLAPLTQAGVLMGTPAYMSPEQFLDAPTGPASDQFAFCVALYEAVLGALPFGGETWQELAAHVVGGERVPEPDAPEVPDWLRQALRRGMALAPEDRYPSMEALLAELTARVAPDGTERRPQRRRWPALALGGALAASVLALGLRAGAPPAVAAEDDAVERLTEAARDAAARLHWVFPPRDDPGDTAYQRVLELETLATVAATERGRALRREFSDALRGLGDYYWQLEGGKAFARDFYIQAVVFTPEDAELSDRTGRTSGEIADLRARAAGGRFTQAELRSGSVAVALADPNPGAAADKLAELAVDEPEPSAIQAEALRVVDRSLRARPASRAAMGPESVERPTAVEPARTEPAKVEPPSPPPVAKPPPAGKPDEAGEPERSGATPADVERAAQLARAARTAAAEGDGREAERLFRQALDRNPNDTDALIGLSDLFFERSTYAQALAYARRAVRLAPRNAGYRLRLGDAYFKAMRYTQAREHYEEAAALGDPLAAGRLARLEEMVGG
jgi:tetratricopeptide (TPR) repeat protein/predicted Ser/Thr protein kinase